MKMMSHWSKTVVLLALAINTMGDTQASAIVFPGLSTGNLIFEPAPKPSQQRNSVHLVQRLVGECRAATRGIFIYRERSPANPVRALQANEQVTLAEDRGRSGWIAIRSPISGFVQTQDLKYCSEDSPVASRSELCRQVVYQGSEGLVIRERPYLNSRAVGRVYGGDQVRLTNPPQFFVADNDPEQREWVRLATPIAGWVSNGSRVQGGINLESCFYR